jgi:KipI family sensor histidine kinase inhibitor
MQNSRKELDRMANQKSGQPHAQAAWRWVGERGVRVATGADALARYEALVTMNFAEIEDVIPADDSVLLVLRLGARVSNELQAALAMPLPENVPAAGTLHEIVVEYGGDAGPDLSALAAGAGLSMIDYIHSHAAVDYTVAFLGFQPGFPYLRGLPSALHAPRRATPRTRVEAGSVAIGGDYTGIYPTEGPGGWQIVGRTRAILFDPAREPPSLLMPGDRVRFVPA